MARFYRRQYRSVLKNAHGYGDSRSFASCLAKGQLHAFRDSIQQDRPVWKWVRRYHLYVARMWPCGRLHNLENTLKSQASKRRLFRFAGALIVVGTHWMAVAQSGTGTAVDLANPLVGTAPLDRQELIGNAPAGPLR
jgi:hypothetical protein